jgi:tight adherence protein B
MDTLVLLASVVGAAAVFLVSYGTWSLATAEREHVARRVGRTGIRSTPRAAVDVRVQGRSSAIFIPVDRALNRYGWAEKAAEELKKAGINLYLSEFVALRLLSTFLALAIPVVLGIVAGEIVFVFVGLIAAVIIWWQSGAVVKRQIAHRQKAIEELLDEALVSIAGSLRAGFSFLQACQLAVTQLSWPLRDELEEMLEEVNFGASLDDALQGLAERIESYEVDIAVNAVLVQRQVGGSLAEILDSVANTIRERRELRGHLFALTAQQRLSAYFVAAVPFLMGIFLTLTSWDFMRPLYTTLVGNLLLVAGFVLDVLGFLLMKRLTRIDF